MIGARVAPGGSGRVDEGARCRRTRVALCAVLLFVALAFPTAAFAAEVPPHVTTEEGPDACAMCHRAHTAPGVVARSQSGSWETTGSALVIADPQFDSGDVALCITCHGIDALGSGVEVQSDFMRPSAHTLLPRESRYDEVPEKQCSSCHDSHGSEKRSDGTPYPGLLRALTETGTPFYTGEEYCATCHYDDRDEYDNRFDGLSIYEQTAHFGLPGPASGTEITCSNCHDSHGADIAPLIVSEVLPPAAEDTATVSANDRTLCYACHTEAQATWLGTDVYDHETTETAHGSSSFEVTLTAEYASEETTRLAGECQSCHNPMGSDNGDGEPIAKLAELEGRELCYSCHNAENVDEGITDMASYGVRPEAILDEPELVVAWDPANLPAAYGGLHVYTRAFGDEEAPFDLEGPRRYKPRMGSTPPRTGAMAYGDIDGSGTALVVADPGAELLRVFRQDPLAGLAEDAQPYPIGATATALEIDDFVMNGDGLPEVAVLLVASDGASTVQLYRHNGTTLAQVGSAASVGSYATGLASGYVTGGEVADLVVTARGDDPLNGGELRIVNWNSSGVPSISVPADTLRGPRGPSVGPVLSGGEIGIVVANSEETSDTISVFDAAGDFVSYKAAIAGSDAVAWDTAVGDFLPGGSSGVAIALRSETSANGVALFEIGASALTPFQLPVQTGVAVASSALAVGDVAGGGDQVAVANAGRFSHTAGESVSPSVMTLATSGSTPVIDETLWGGGAEMAGGEPAVAVVDLGPVGRSRHPASAVPGAHVSTETAGFERHAECVDCHNTHALTSEPRIEDAPNIYGVITGAWGLDVEATEATLAAPADYEYQVCFKCHASADNVAWGDSPRDIAAEFNSLSAHPVMGTEAELYCVDCHGNAGAGPEGPHVSSAAPLLSSPLIGTRSSEAAMLCYQCHDKSLYYDGTDPVTVTEFRHGDDLNLHVLHGQSEEGYGLGCESCHASHGSENEHLVRDGLDWQTTATGGECTTECHTWDTYAYSRSGSAWTSQESAASTLQSVYFADPQSGWIVGNANTILRTTDGGTNWAAAANPGTPSRILRDVHFVNASTGWLVGNDGTIRASSDGGDTWVAQTSGVSENLHSMHFVDANHGWVVGDAGTVLATTDGGANWVAQTSGVSENLNAVYFVDKNVGWAVGARIDDNGTLGSGRILATTDGGATWTAQDSGALRVLHDVHFTNATTGWVVGNAGTVLATIDGGATWTAMTAGVPATQLLSVRFIDRFTGWAVGAGGTVLHTKDGGALWSAQDSGGTPPLRPLRSVYPLDHRTGFAVGGEVDIVQQRVIARYDF